MSVSSYGWETSIDIAQQQKLTRPLSRAAKRSHDEFSTGNALLQEVTIHALPPPTAKGPFQSLAKNRIAASAIRSVGNDDQYSSYQLSRARTLGSTLPGPSQTPLLSLSCPRYGLPDPLVQNFASMGINSMYPWQSSCLLGRGLLEGERNLVYTAPTGGGKSFVADVLMLKRIIEDPSKKAILVLPYVALVQEKLKFLRKVVNQVQKTKGINTEGTPTWKRKHDSSIRVVGFFGGSKVRATWRDLDIAVCTIEKVYS